MNPYSCWTCTACACQVLFRQKIKSSSSRWILVSKMYHLIAFYQRMVELWCQTRNFPNDPHIVVVYNRTEHSFKSSWQVTPKSAAFQLPCADPDGRQGVPTPPPNHKNIGSLSNTGPDFLKITNLPSRNSELGHHRHVIYMAFRWRADDGPILVVFGSTH